MTAPRPQLVFRCGEAVTDLSSNIADCPAVPAQPALCKEKDDPAMWPALHEGKTFFFHFNTSHIILSK